MEPAGVEFFSQVASEWGEEITSELLQERFIVDIRKTFTDRHWHKLPWVELPSLEVFKECKCGTWDGVYF